MTWHYEDLERRLDVYIGPTDPGDAKTRKRLTIVQAATALFVEQGYRKTSVGQIAERANVAKGTVYLYFETKIELLLMCIAMEKKEYLDRLRPIFTEAMEPAARLKRWLSTVLVMAHEMPLTSRLLRGDQELLAILEQMPPELMEENDHLRIEFLGNMIDEVAGDHRWNRIELEDRVKVLTGLTYLSGMLNNEHVRGGVAIDRFATILADMVVDGIAPSRKKEEISEEMVS